MKAVKATVDDFKNFVGFIMIRLITLPYHFTELFGLSGRMFVSVMKVIIVYFGASLTVDVDFGGLLDKGDLRIALIRDILQLTERILYIIEFYGFQWILSRISSMTAKTFARFNGYWTFQDGSKSPLSMVNVMSEASSCFALLPQNKNDTFPYTNDLHPDRSNLHFLAQCSKLAYEKHKIVKDVASTWGFKASSFEYEKTLIPSFWKVLSNMRAPEIFACVMYNKQSIVLAFRGTDPLNMHAWFTDFSIEMRDLPEEKYAGCRVHQGIQKSNAKIFQDGDFNKAVNEGTTTLTNFSNTIQKHIKRQAWSYQSISLGTV